MKDRPPSLGSEVHHNDDEKEIASLLRTMGPLDRVPDDELPPIKAAAHAAWRRQVRRTTTRRAAYAALAIAATVILAVTASLLRSPASPPEATVIAATLESVVGDATVGERAAAATATEVVSGTTILTGVAGRTALRLTAGHSVRVDVSSSVRIVSGDSLLLERGAIYVDTDAAAGGDVAAIEIETPFGRVTDLGTRFEVRLIEGDESADSGGGDGGAVPAGMRVAVREGRVKLATAFGDYEAAAGSELSFYAGGRLDRAGALPYGPSWSWVESVRPPLEVDGVGLTAFLDWAARESGRRWRFTGSAGTDDDHEAVLHGSIDGMTVEEALATMLPSAGLRHRVDGDEILIDRVDG